MKHEVAQNKEYILKSISECLVDIKSHLHVLSPLTHAHTQLITSYIVPGCIPLCVAVHPYLLYVLCDSPLTLCPSHSPPPPSSHSDTLLTAQA